MTAAFVETARVHHPVFARFYARLVDAAQDKGQREHRVALLEDLSGRVLEVGAGTGTNFRLYPAEVTDLVAVEPESHLRSLAETAASQAGVPIHVVNGIAELLPLDDASCDAAVVSLVLCSVMDPARALQEIRRVVRPGGELRFYEHVLSDTPWGVRMQRAVDHLGWPHLSGGCHTSRNTVAAMEEAGFRIDTLRRFRFSGLPHVLGVARRT